MKLDANGTIVWQTTVDNGTLYQDPYAIFENSMGLFILGANSVSRSGGETWIVQLDLNGSLISNATRGTSGTNEYAYGADISGDDYIMTGSGNQSSSWDKDIYIVQDHGSGVSSWTYGDGTSTGHDEGRDVAFTADGGAIITGYTETWGAGGRDAFLLKIDSLGAVQWMEVYGGGLDDEARFVGQTVEEKGNISIVK